MMTNGYVFQEKDGKFLAERLYWYSHEVPEVAWVHPKSMLQKIRSMCGEWEVKPEKVYPAVYSSAEGVKIIGEPFDF